MDVSPTGLENLALVVMLLTSGLRASELCGLRWGAVQQSEGWYCTFTAKGGDTQEQPLCRRGGRRWHVGLQGRHTTRAKAEDALFLTLPAHKRDRPRPLFSSNTRRAGRAGRERGGSAG